MAPLGAFIEDKSIYLPFALYGIVPGLVLSSALVVKYAPLFEQTGGRDHGKYHGSRERLCHQPESSSQREFFQEG